MNLNGDDIMEISRYSSQLPTFTAVLALWSGPKDLAEATGLEYQRVNAWIHRGRVSSGGWPFVMKAAKDKGHILTSVDFFRLSEAAP